MGLYARFNQDMYTFLDGRHVQTVRNTRRDTRTTIHWHIEPKLEIVMNFAQRQQYCSNQGIEFTMPHNNVTVQQPSFGGPFIPAPNPGFVQPNQPYAADQAPPPAYSIATAPELDDVKGSFYSNSTNK